MSTPAKDNVKRLDSGAISKSGWLPHILREAEAMNFVRKHTSLPVPAVLSVEELGSETTCLVMEFIEGESLETAWFKMDEAKQNSVADQLRSYLEELRSLPQPHPGWIESCSGGEGMDHRILAGEPFGPLSSVGEFHDLLLAKTKKHCTRHPDVMYHYWEHRNKLLDHYATVFSHADLKPNHILVDPIKGRIVGIIDWEMAGFWLEYWEYRKAMFGYAYTYKGWEGIVERVMKTYLAEREFDDVIQFF